MYDTFLQLYKNIELDKNHRNSIWFESVNQQITYFNKFVLQTFQNLSYQRVNDNTLRVTANRDIIISANYLRFRNVTPEAVDGKTYFCFIDEIRYINEHTSEIVYTVDPIQTFMFDFKVGECFVEREHSLTDGLYENLVEEGFNVGDKYCQHLQIENLGAPTDVKNPYYNYELVLFYTGDKQISVSQPTELLDGKSIGVLDRLNVIGTTFGGTAKNYTNLNGLPTSTNVVTAKLYEEYLYYGGSETSRININDVYISVLLEALSNVITESNITINAMYIVPQGCFELRQLSVSPTETYPIAIYPANVYERNYHCDGVFSNCGGTYTPKNKKLLTAPYRNIKITTPTDCKRFYWEKTDKNVSNTAYNFEFKIICCVSPSPTFGLYPYGYNGFKGDGALTNYNECVLFGNVPTVSLVVDYFARYMEQHGTQILLGTISTAVQGFATYMNNPQGVISGGIQAGANITSGVLNTIGSMNTARKHEDIVYGSINNSGIDLYGENLNFKLEEECLSIYEAEQIDTFFESYGYAVKRVKTPNLYSNNSECRKYWNYIKTAGCHLEYNKSFPFNYIQEIEGIFDNGITFWMCQEDGTVKLCDYSQDNSPVV